MASSHDQFPTFGEFVVVACTYRCPWAQRAWIALEEKKIKYETHLVDKTAKPKEFLQLYQAVWPDADAIAKVPTIVGRARSFASPLADHAFCV